MVFVLSLHILLTQLCASPTAPPEPPNMVLIVADDLGWGDTGFDGQAWVKTPNLDKLAAAGTVFQNAYAGSAYSSASVCSLLTGLHSGHLTTSDTEGVTLSPSLIALPELLESAGYATAFIGKWAPGGSSVNKDGVEDLITGLIPTLPTQKGFLNAYALLNARLALDPFPEFLWRNTFKEPVEGNAGKKDTKRVAYGEDLFTQEALKVIQAGDGAHPFFLEIHYPLPHQELKTPPRAAPFDDGALRAQGLAPTPDDIAYASLVSYLDQDVGNLVAAIDGNTAIAGKTAIIFTSDTGSQSRDKHSVAAFKSNGPYRGEKLELYEGGLRVPFIMRLPAQFSAPRSIGYPVYFPDVLPTMAALAQLQPPGGIDGVSLLPLLEGGTRALPADRAMIWVQRGEHVQRAIRKDMDGTPWKLIESGSGPAALFNLASDPAETTDLAPVEPKRVEQLTAALDAAVTGQPEVHAPALAIGGDAEAGQPITAFDPPEVSPATLLYYRFEEGKNPALIEDAAFPGAHNVLRDGGARLEPNVFFASGHDGAGINRTSCAFGSKLPPLVIPHDDKLDFENSFTLEAWVRLDPAPGTQWILVNKTPKGGAGSVNHAWAAALGSYASAPNAFGKVAGQTGREMGLVFGTGKSFWTLVSKLSLPDNAWHYVSVVCETLDGRATFHLDSQTDTVTFINKAKQRSEDNQLVIGAWPAGTSRFKEYLTGNLDELRVSKGKVADVDLLFARYATYQQYRIDFGPAPIGRATTKMFQVRNAATAYAQRLAGDVATEFLDDPRIQAEAGPFRPLVDKEARDFTLTFTPDSDAPLANQFVVLNAHDSATGAAVAGSPVLIHIEGVGTQQIPPAASPPASAVPPAQDNTADQSPQAPAVPPTVTSQWRVIAMAATALLVVVLCAGMWRRRRK